MSKWISVKDRLPKEYESVLAFDGASIYIAHQFDGSWMEDRECMDINPSYWMPLPEAPK